MNTGTYINRKKEYNRIIKNLVEIKGYRLVKDSANDNWKLFDKDSVVAEIQFEILDAISMIEIKVPMREDLQVSEEIFLRPIVTEYDFREKLGADRLRKMRDKLEIFRRINVYNKERNRSEKLLLNITDLIAKADTISLELQYRMDLVMQIKLN